MKYKKGQSGNPLGRPKGSKDKRTELRELLEPHASALIEKAVSMALAGDTTAMKMCLDRIIPSLKSIEIKTEVEKADDVLRIIVADSATGQEKPFRPDYGLPSG